MKNKYIILTWIELIIWLWFYPVVSFLIAEISKAEQLRFLSFLMIFNIAQIIWFLISFKKVNQVDLIHKILAICGANPIGYFLILKSFDIKSNAQIDHTSSNTIVDSNIFIPEWEKEKMNNNSIHRY